MESQINLNSLPNEILRIIFSKMDGLSLCRHSRLCFSWNRLITSLGNKKWRAICHGEFGDYNFQQIAVKKSPGATITSWKQIYKSYCISNQTPDKWAKEETVLRLTPESSGQYSEVKIHKGNVYGFFQPPNDSPREMHLYSLETKTLLDIYPFKRPVRRVVFDFIEVDGQSFLIYLTNSLDKLYVLEVDQNRFATSPSSDIPNLQSFVTSRLPTYKNYLQLQSKDKLFILRAERNASANNSLAFEIALVEANDYDEYFFWNNYLVGVTSSFIKLFTFDQEASYEEVRADLNFPSKSVAHVWRPDSITIDEEKLFGEINREQPLVNHARYRNLLCCVPKMNCFANLFFGLPTGNNNEGVKLITPEDVRYFLATNFSYAQTEPRMLFDACFHKNSLVTVLARDSAIVIQTYSVAASLTNVTDTLKNLKLTSSK